MRQVPRVLASFVYLALAGAYLAIATTWTRARWRARGVRLSRGVVVRAGLPESIELGAGVVVGSGTLLIATSEMSELPQEASRLQVGAGSAINEYCNLRASGGAIEIGSKCLLAQFVTIVASNHSTKRGQPMIDQAWSSSTHSVRVGDDVWLGAGVTVLPGSTIGDGAVVAANAVVRGHIPAGQIWGGIPARFLRNR